MRNWYEMKVLVGIVDYNPGVKDYALLKLYENISEYIEPNADILFISDREHEWETIHEPIPHSWMSEDILYVGRDVIREIAVKRNYDAFVWQGLDCYYHGSTDFVRLIDNAFDHKFFALGGLTAARSDENFPVARRFTGFEHFQRNIPDDELMSGECISCFGFPGADALVVRGDLMHESWTQFKGFKPWYELRPTMPDSLCIEEYWILKMGLKYGDVIGLDTSVRTWHAHEDGIARRWPGETKRISDLTFV